ncbi:MAG: TIR domain-containing protein [Zoogloeaceae bacterium]|nr:TIR domain-containing protein [Zoogloeaceae bacterium]
MAEIFISYRREDAGGYAGRLEEGLERLFGTGSAFRDVVDLQPGEDYLQALNSRIAAAVAILVVIGPRWLTAERDGRRRLEGADDVVRQEIKAALASGKPVFPVLVGGAVMPEAMMLPQDLVDLARFQAVQLTDLGWESDLRRLGAVLAPLLSRRTRGGRRLWLGVAGAALLTAMAGGGAWWWRQRPDPSGTWVGEVVYDWGYRRQEEVVLEKFAGQWRGTASYLGVARPMSQLEVRAGALGFQTHSEVMMGGETRQLTHHYVAEFQGDRLDGVLTTEGGFSPYRPVRFTLNRRAPPP